MYQCKILADSLNPKNIRLTTFEISFPRIVLSEFNTHRVFSRNSSSSRAIPIITIINRVKTDPFIPEYWGKNQKGMSADEELTPEQIEKAKEIWLRSRDSQIGFATEFMDLGVHKQISNRLLEVWMYQTVIVSATEWTNFFNLRDEKNAQPEIRKIAQMMKKAYKSNEPVPLNSGEWHRPLLDDKDVLSAKYGKEDMNKICVGRCCRVSYLTHDGIRDPQKDIELANKIGEDHHMSPFEHCAKAMVDEKKYGNFRGWKQYRKYFSGEDVFLPHE